MKKSLIVALVLIAVALASGCIPPPGAVHVSSPAPRAVYVRPAPPPRRVVVRVNAPTPPPPPRVHVQVGR